MDWNALVAQLTNSLGGNTPASSWGAGPPGHRLVGRFDHSGDHSRGTDPGRCEPAYRTIDGQRDGCRGRRRQGRLLHRAAHRDDRLLQRPRAQPGLQFRYRASPTRCSASCRRRLRAACCWRWLGSLRRSLGPPRPRRSRPLRWTRRSRAKRICSRFRRVLGTCCTGSFSFSSCRRFSVRWNSRVCWRRCSRCWTKCWACCRMSSLRA